MNKNWGMLGHEWAVELLLGQIVRGQVRHAYLFCGSHGVGRRTLAIKLAQALNCTGPKEPGDPCGECRECRQIASSSHPDLSITQAEIEGGAMKVDQVRELRRTLVLKPFQAQYRVAILPRFQEATDEAANALLKTLEEAPPQVVLILTADHPEHLLPTITSRCEVLRLRPLAFHVLEAELTDRGIASEQARLLAHISGGRPGLALKLAGEDGWIDRRRERFDEQLKLISANRLEKFSFAEHLSKDKGVMRQTLLLWISYWRDVLLLASGSQVPISNIDRQGEIESLAETLSMPEVERLLQRLEKTLDGIEANVNSRLAAEVLLLDWPVQ
jgi:DNA polymerase-3 subunit delta'